MPVFCAMGKRRHETAFKRMRLAAGLGDKATCAELLGVTVRTVGNFFHCDGTAII
jgi:hypothetical protein